MIALTLRVLVVGLATYRLARAVSIDTISAPFRAWVFWRGHYEIDGTIANPHDGTRVTVETSRPWAWFYGLVSCPFCCGWWIALALFLAWQGWSWTNLLAAVAAAGIGAQLTGFDHSTTTDTVEVKAAEDE